VRYVLTLFAILAGGGRLVAQATGALSGVVTERGDLPVAGAEVVLPGHPVATTNARGAWRIGEVAPGRVSVTIRRLGYTPRTFTVEVAAGGATTLPVLLEPMALPIEELVVTASRRPERLADAVVTTELIDRRTIESTAAPDMAAVLTEQTGIQMAGGHPSGTGVMLQGMSSERVLILLDGQPLSGRLSGTFDLARIPTTAVERVEVVKGPQSTLYGSEAMGGVVNIITRRPDGLASRLDTRLLVGGAGRKQADITGETGIGAVRANGAVGLRQQDRVPGDPDETGALAKETDASGAIVWRPEGNYRLEASGLFTKERLRSQSGTLYTFGDNTQIAARLVGRRQTETHLLQATLHGSEFTNLARSSAYPEPIAGTGNTQVQRLIEADLLWHGPVLPRLTADLGTEGRSEYISSTDGRIEGGPRSLGTFESYGQLEWTVGRLAVVPGTRVSVSEQWGTTATPRLAMRFHASDPLTLRASASKGFRAPDFKELYLDFTNEPAGYAVRGNPDLTPEQSVNLSAGADWSVPTGYARVSGYWNELNDFIETRPLASSGSLVEYTYANVADGNTWGVDAEVGVVRGPLRLELGYGWLGTRDGETGGVLLGRPEHSGRAMLGLAAAKGPRLTATVVYTGSTPMERDSTGAISSTREAFARLDLRAAQRLMWGLELSAGVDNVFNEKPAEWAGAVGRQAYVSMSWGVTSGR
jgi:outer membrane receptor for ferrienterochelin and colicins